jgi:hypothetical protein
MKEKLEVWALVAEIVGAFAIVASLIFVGLQVNQNNKLIMASSMDASNLRADNMSKLAIEFGVISITQKVRAGETLTIDENGRMTIFIETILRHYETTYYQYNLGLVDEESWQSNLYGLRSFTTSVSFLTVFPDWENSPRTGQFGKSFVDFVSEQIDQLSQTAP